MQMILMALLMIANIILKLSPNDERANEIKEGAQQRLHPTH